MTTFSPARGSALIGIGCALSGAVGGLVWGLLAPGRSQVVAHGGLLSVAMSGDHIFDALAIFFWVTAAVGVVTGAAAWTWRRMRGPATAVAMLLGSFVGAWLAAGIGGLVTRARFDWPGAQAVSSMVGQVVTQPPTVDQWAVLIAQPLGAGIVYIVATLLAPHSDLSARGNPGGGAAAEDGPVEPGTAQ